jgi:hypothetical protein
MLEETIAQLEARIQELENPSSIPGSVTLHDPRSTFFQTQLSPLIGPRPASLASSGGIFAWVAFFCLIEPSQR